MVKVLTRRYHSGRSRPLLDAADSRQGKTLDSKAQILGSRDDGAGDGGWEIVDAFRTQISMR
jgi:hypothetical protein